MTRILSRVALGGLVAASAVIGGVACSGGGGSGGGTPTPSCTGTPFTDTSLANLQNQIISPTCAISGSCHLGPTSIITGFDLSNASATRASTVGISTTAYLYSGQQETYNGNKLPIVATNMSTNGSYLFLKITASPGIYGVGMPQTGQALCANQIEAIGAWIRAGAP